MTAMNTAMTAGMTSQPLERLMLFTGNANPRLAQEVAKPLNLSLGRAIVGKFSDGEVMVELLENVRGKDVFVLQSTCAPTNDNLMELLVMIDALKRSSAARDQRQGRRQHAAVRRRGAAADDGPACRPDPGFLRHPGRQHLCRAGPARRRVEAALRRPDRGVARRRRRGARTRAREAPR